MFMGLDLRQPARWLLAAQLVIACTIAATNSGAAEPPGHSGGADAGAAGSCGDGCGEAPPLVREVKPAYAVKPAEVVRGSLVTIIGTNLPQNCDAVTVWLDDIAVGQPTHVASDRKTMTFVVPEQGDRDGEQQPISVGHHAVKLSVSADAKSGENAKKEQTIAVGLLRVTSEKVPSLQLDAVDPTVIYPDMNPIVLTGSGFGGKLADYALLVDDSELDLCEKKEPSCQSASCEKADPTCKGPFARFTSDHQLEVEGPFLDPRGAYLRGEHQLRLRSGNATSKLKKVAFSSHTPSEVRGIAIGTTAAILLAMVLLAACGSKPHKIGSKEFIGRAFLIDTETDSYSLSKLQFYLWSAAALLAYCYLSLSRALVQGRLDIADIPPNLPGIWALSAGTAIASVGITKVVGPKAAGSVHPSFSDLLATGGVVSPERFQFLLWTVVAVATFVLNVWHVDPMVLNDLPRVPDNLLALSGVSSIAYLGGKAVRGAGPIIDEIIPTRPRELPSGLELTIMGRNLGLDASFEVDGDSITQLIVPDKDGNQRAKPIKFEEGDKRANFAKALKLTLRELPSQWSEGDGEHSLTLANKDGQRATWPVSLVAAPSATPSPPAVDDPPPIASTRPA